MWRSLGVRPSALRIDTTLLCGQTFRWKTTGDNEFSGIVGGDLVTLKQTADDVLVRVAVAQGDHEDTLMKLRDYFCLETPLEPLYAEWAAADPRFKQLANIFPGMRVVRQDPVECLFSFICSSNNHISRITQMIDKLCSRYGTTLGHVPGSDVPFCSFPTVDSLAEAQEQELRDLGFGYRAKFVVGSARAVMEAGGAPWLMGLRKVSHADARLALTQLPGVGPKVADCVCLMCLDKIDAIPVDTHVLAITKLRWLPSLEQLKSLTPRIYNEIGDVWRSKFRAAGWAHTVFFAADIAAFRERVAAADAIDPDAASPKKKTPKKATPKKSPSPSKDRSPAVKVLPAAARRLDTGDAIVVSGLDEGENDSGKHKRRRTVRPKKEPENA